MDTQYKKDFIKAGQIAKEVRAFGKGLLIPGASYNEVIRQIRDKIHELGAVPAFPPQIAPNFIGAHYLPEPGEDMLFSNQLLKLDVGICVNGAIGDCAGTVDLSGKYKHLINAAEAALAAAESMVKVGVTVSEIGAAIEETITSFGLQPIRNLTGHGLGKFQVHTSPHFPNYKDNSKYILKPGMTFAIEPFSTDGRGLIYDAGNPTIFSLNKRNKQYTGVVGDVYEIAKDFGGLPFCTHDLITEKTPAEGVKKAIHFLIKEKVITGYAPLVEETKGFVAQAENSFLIDEHGEVFITTR